MVSTGSTGTMKSTDSSPELDVRARYRGLLSATSDLIFWSDLNGVVVDYHANAPEDLAVKPEHFLGHPLGENLPDEVGNLWSQAVAQARESGHAERFEYSLPFPGEVRRYEARTYVCENGEVVTLVHNITTRFKLAEKLSQSEARYRSVVESQVDLVCLCRPDSVLTFVNEAFCRYFGKSFEALAGRSFCELIPERNHKAARQALRDFVENPSPLAWENEIISGSGEIRWQQWSFSPILDSQGKVTEIQGVGRDCTDRKRAEMELSRREREFETLADNAPDIITRHDSEMRYQYVNRAFCDIMGNPPSHFLGKTGRELGLSEIAQGPFEQAARQAFESRRFVSVLVSGGEPGQERSFQINVVPEFTESGEPSSVLSIGREVTELTRARRTVEESNRDLEKRVNERTEELTALNQELAQALRLKDEFLASMSHELRTPLNAMLGFTQAIRDQIYGPASDKLLNAARIADAGGHHLLELINDILDLSKIQAGMLKLSLNPVPVQSLCEGSLQIVEKAAQRKRLQISLSVAPGSGVLIADGRRLKQMLVNLLSNAVKFTPEDGRIELSVQGDRESRVIRFAVTDTGIGIPKEHIPRLFQPFTQVDSQLSRPHSGTGLGLSLVLNIAALHGGGVEVKSEPGVGSTFTILLPWAEKQIVDLSPSRDPGSQGALFHAAQEAGPKRLEGGQPKHLLLAEDNEGNALFVSDLLSAKGYKVSIARNGFEAIQLARRLEPDLVLMDIQMPGMDGLEAIRRLRAADATKHIPIIALTALAMAGDRERCLSAGANGYVTKPLDFTFLTDMTRSILGQEG